MRGRLVLLLACTMGACMTGRGRSTQRVLTEPEWNATASCLTAQAHARGYGFYITPTEIVVTARSQTDTRQQPSTLNADPTPGRPAYGPREVRDRPATIAGTRHREEAIVAYRAAPSGIVATAMVRAFEGREGQWAKAAPSRAIEQVHQRLVSDCLAKVGRPSST
ncbi:MAG: hypothetical protein H7066_18355 [Cytophagaceae bacterium]|nr:hypothetical protein [Gemmatimonadaceae bacterium]